MPVTNAVFDFNGTAAFGDVDGTNPTSDTSIAGGGTGTGSVTEQGVTFSYSFTGAGNANFSALFVNLSVSSGSATLDINDTPDEAFFSNLVFNFSSVSGPSNSIVLSRTLTTLGVNPLGTPVTAVIPNSQIISGVVTAPAGQWNTIQFNATGGFIGLTSITSTVNCFLPGTAIATDAGETAVETLKAGDLVRTADGRLEKVVWLGEMKIDTRLMHPAKVNPICITAGALGDGLPKRDLYLSADHAIEIDGALYNAGALVNGSSIYQLKSMPQEGFTYYHVETEAHELVLAEGVASESFIDYTGRDSFTNAATAENRVIPEMDLPRVSTARLVPEALRARLAGIAAEMSRKAA